MARTTFFGKVSGDIYRSKEGVSETRRGAKSFSQIVDSVVEYPGSVKGDNGRWYLTEWVEAKVDQIVKSSGKERK